MRNRLIKLLLLPVAMFLWLIGWTMTWAATRKEQERRRKTAKEEQSIAIILLTSEKQEQYEARTLAQTTKF